MTLTFSEKTNEEFHAACFRVESDNSPVRELNAINVPGRSGDLLIDGKRYPNKEIVYKWLFYGEDAEENCDNAKQFLLSRIGYQRLEDSEHPGEFRLAYVSEDIEPQTTKARDMWKFELTLTAKPQRYLVSGETVTTLTASGSITNPTLFESRPLLRVYGTGILGIGTQSITITQTDVFTDIDCEMMDAYKGAASKNAYVRLSNYNFPVLKAGANNFSLGSGITRVEITPRWFKL